MKILVTASTFPRWKDDSIPEFVLNQLQALKKEFPGLELHALVPHHAGAEVEERIGDINVHRFRYFWPESLQKVVYPAILPNIRTRRTLLLQIPFLLLFETLAIYRLCKSLRPDCLYSHWFVPQVITGGWVALLLNIRHVFTNHSSDVQAVRALPVVGPFLVRFFLRRLIACTVVSKRSYEKLQSFFGEDEWALIREKIKIIPMGVSCVRPKEDAGSSTAAKELLGLPVKKIILFMGRFSEKRGITYLLQAYEEIIKELDDTILILAGDGELRASIDRQRQQQDLAASVHMPGYVTGRLKARYLNAADILVVPSIIARDGDAEGLPVSLLEGLSAGKVCVATDVSGGDDILVHGENGFLVESQNSSQLAETFKEALRLSKDEYQVIADNAMRCAAAFDWEIVARKYYEHFFRDLDTTTRR